MSTLKSSEDQSNNKHIEFAHAYFEAGPGDQPASEDYEVAKVSAGDGGGPTTALFSPSDQPPYGRPSWSASCENYRPDDAAMSYGRALNIVRGYTTNVTPEERRAAWQKVINSGEVWRMTHREGYSLGREAARLIHKRICTDTPANRELGAEHEAAWGKVTAHPLYAEFAARFEEDKAKLKEDTLLDRISNQKALLIDREHEITVLKKRIEGLKHSAGVKDQVIKEKRELISRLRDEILVLQLFA